MRIIRDFKGSNSFLSNFATSPIRIKGKSYHTVEHYYQAMKAMNKTDHEMIRTATTLGIAKAIGQEIQLREDWGKIKISVMYTALKKKFSVAINKRRLLSTETKILIEGNEWHDNIWGECECGGCYGREYSQNLLGVLLMLVRSELHER